MINNKFSTFNFNTCLYSFFKSYFTYSKKYLKHYYSNKSLNKIFNKDKKMYFSHLEYIVINTNFTKQDLIKLVNILKKIIHKRR